MTNPSGPTTVDSGQTARRGWPVRAWSVLVAALTAAAGVAVWAAPAHADINLDRALCLSGAAGTVSLSQPAVLWGDLTGISWSTNLPTYCGGGIQATVHLFVGDLEQGSTVGTHGTIWMPPPTTSQVTLTLLASGESKVLASAPVTVNPYDPVALADGTEVTITGNDPQSRRNFVQAVRSPAAKVTVAGNVSLDLSGLENVPVAAGVRIIGDRSIYPAGPRLFTTTFPALSPRALLMIGSDAGQTSDNVRITGIRLQGAESDDPWTAVDKPGADGIAVYSSQHVEIDHSEIDHWRGSGVNVHDPLRLINQDNAGTVWVHDNYIHHNQHPGAQDCVNDLIGHGHAAGYGVVISTGAYALIERNVFDYNRHAIAGDGSEGAGYFAYRNLILNTGGVHFRCLQTDAAWVFVLPPFVSIVLVTAGVLDLTGVYHTHAIDMHGTGDGGTGDHSGGLAGEYMDIEYNAVLYTLGNGIHLRGTPQLAWYSPPVTTRVGMAVRHNVFAHEDQWGGVFNGVLSPGAMVQNETGLDPSDNLYGVNTFNERKTCDLDGDGIGDSLIATGVTWWYASSQLGGRWVYLNQSAARIADLSVGDVNGDGLCDVTGGGTVFTNPGPDVLQLNPMPDRSDSAGTTVQARFTTVPGDFGPYTWSATGLPVGVTLDPATGVISGTLAWGGTYHVDYTVHDRYGDTASRGFTWTVAVRVPNLYSLTVTQATTALQAVGLAVGTHGTLSTDDSALNLRVVQQYTAAGTPVPIGSAVNFSTGVYFNCGTRCP